ncbi:MAG: hypothetical protein ACXVHQ_33815, partial [Solirubrobacteraceae bacterium]
MRSFYGNESHHQPKTVIWGNNRCKDSGALCALCGRRGQPMSLQPNWDALLSLHPEFVETVARRVLQLA